MLRPIWPRVADPFGYRPDEARSEGKTTWPLPTCVIDERGDVLDP
jgi:hypothetical protein